MRILIFRKRGAKLPRTLNQRTREKVAALIRVRINLLDCPYDQRTDGCPGFLGPVPQPLMQWVRKVNCGANRHDIIMSSRTDLRRLTPPCHRGLQDEAPLGRTDWVRISQPGITTEYPCLRACWYRALSKVTRVDCKPFEDASSKPSPIHLEAGLTPNGSVTRRNSALQDQGRAIIPKMDALMGNSANHRIVRDAKHL